MKKILLIGIVIVLLSGSVLGGKEGEVKGEVKEGEKIGKEKIEQEDSEEQESQGFKGTLKEMMKLGVSLKCSWEQEEDSGISYIKDESIYVEIVVDERKEYMIQKDDCMWIWSGEDKEGIKMCFEKEEESYEASEVDWEMEYECIEEEISLDRFDLAEGVEFTDMNDVLETFLPE